MSEIKHTPGPWTNHGRITQPGLPHSAVAAETLIARVYSKHFGDTEQEIANANLIAAAPDLLTVSEHAIQWLQGDKWRFDGDPTKRESWEIMMRALKNAVAKARGES